MSEQYEQLTITDYLAMQIENKSVKDLTSWINSQGEAQYTQIGKIIKRTYEREKDSKDLLDRLTNAVSIYVLEQSIGYMDYLRNQVK